MQKTSGLSPRNLFPCQPSGARFLPLLAFVLIALGLRPAPVLAQAPNVTYNGPLTITTGGTYSGNYRSTDSNTPVIRISTNQPVILENCILAGAGDIIWANGGGANLTIRNNQAYGLVPSVDGRARGRFLAASSARNLNVTNNYLENTTGFTIYQWTGDGSATQTVKIIRNKVKNIDGRHRNGGFTMSNFVGLNTVRNVGNIEIAWNEVINQPDLSSVEDNINFYNSGGTAASPARVYNNYVQGAYPLPATHTVFSGTGMTTDGDGNTAATTAAFVQAYQNQFVSICNAAMNIAAGHDIRYYNNRMVTSGMLADGRKLMGTYAATAIFNAYQQPSSVMYGNSVDNNVIGFVKWGYNSPFADRHDLSIGACSNCPSNTHMPNPITMTAEQNEWNLWQQKLQQNAVTLGVGGAGGGSTPTAPATPANQAPTVSLTASVASLTLGQALTLTATAADADGSVSKVEFFSGATKLGEDLTAPFSFGFTPAALGSLSLTARATDNAGATANSAALGVSILAAPTTTTTPTAPANAAFFRAFNMNGPATTIDGHAWQSSIGATNLQHNGGSYSNPALTIGPATDGARLSMIRSCVYTTSSTLTAAASVPNGSYSVYLYFMEDDIPTTYNISVEGQVVRSYTSTGGRWERLGPFTANVTDGNVSIATSGGVAGLSGIEIWQNGTTTTSTPAPTTGTRTLFRAVNVNGPAATIDGLNYQSGAAGTTLFTTNGGRFENQGVALNPATDAARTQMIRSSVWSSSLNLTIPNVPNGTYEVSYYIWEDNSAATFSATVNGQPLLTSHNSGAAGTWRKTTPLRVNVTNGQIVLQGSGGDMNVSGFEVFSVQ